jgi:hypothetical protein
MPLFNFRIGSKKRNDCKKGSESTKLQAKRIQNQRPDSIAEGTYITEKQPLGLNEPSISKIETPKTFIFQNVIIEWWQEY